MAIVILRNQVDKIPFDMPIEVAEDLRLQSNSQNQMVFQSLPEIQVKSCWSLVQQLF